MAQFSFFPTGDAHDLATDIRALFDDLAASLAREHRAYSGECRPSLDVFETDATVEVIVDLSGVPAAAVRVLFRGGVLIVAGEKAPSPAASDQTYHRVERDFGRFARVVRLTGAFDIPHARATLHAGELAIVLPKRDDRRGQGHLVAVTTGDAARA